MNNLAFEKCYKHLKDLSSFAYIPTAGKSILIISFRTNDENLVKLTHICSNCQSGSSIILKKDVIRSFYNDEKNISERGLHISEVYLPLKIGTGSVHLFLPEFLRVLYEKVCPIITLSPYCIIKLPSYL